MILTGSTYGVKTGVGANGAWIRNLRLHFRTDIALAAAEGKIHVRGAREADADKKASARRFRYPRLQRTQ
jgi:hypothetical protein